MWAKRKPGCSVVPHSTLADTSEMGGQQKDVVSLPTAADQPHIICYTSALFPHKSTCSPSIWSPREPLNSLTIGQFKITMAS